MYDIGREICVADIQGLNGAANSRPTLTPRSPNHRFALVAMLRLSMVQGIALVLSAFTFSADAFTTAPVSLGLRSSSLSATSKVGPATATLGRHSILRNTARSAARMPALRMADGEFDYDVIIVGCGVGGHGAALHARGQVSSELCTLSLTLRTGPPLPTSLQYFQNVHTPTVHIFLLFHQCLACRKRELHRNIACDDDNPPKNIPMTLLLSSIRVSRPPSSPAAMSAAHA